MSKLRFTISMSLDGFVAGPNQSVENPLGEGGEELHEWAFAVRAFRKAHGMEGGATGIDDEVVAESVSNIGATIMGRHMFGGGDGPWGTPVWNGWWGDEPPFRVPVFVLTHHARAPLEMRGGTTFYFVTDGIEAALSRAQEAAAGKDVTLAGGANVARQYLRRGLVDEMDLHVVPILLGSGERLFEDTAELVGRFEPVRIVSSPAVSHYKLRQKQAR